MSASQAELAHAVGLILHGDDHIKCVLEADIEVTAPDAPDKTKRLLALISHRDELDGHEEGRQARLFTQHTNDLFT